MIENIHIIQLHPLKTLIQAGYQVFSASSVPVRPRPHIITRLSADYHLVPVRTHITVHNSSEVIFRTAVNRAVIISQIKMRDSIVKRSENKLLHIVEIILAAKIMPKSQRNGRKLQTALSAAKIFHALISVFFCLIHSFSSFKPADSR